MGKKMLINATHPEENRVAIVEDGILTELDIEIAGKEQSRGNVYKAVVVRVEQGLQAAFVDYGGERFGFLQMGEIHPLYFRNGESEGDARRMRITDVLRRGQELLVQVVKEERGTKGAALTTFISLPGRFMVLMPDSDTHGVSRKIEEEGQRKKLKEAMASLDLPANMGYIVRTAGIGQKKEELKRDFNYLVRVWEKIREESRQTAAPALIYKESNLVIRSIRDYFSADMDEVLVDDPRVYQEAKDFFQQVMPEYARLVKLHQEKRQIFSRYQIEEQIETISKNKVPLPSGGSIVIDSTEALVAVDVNSGKMAGEQNVEATAYKTNLEAATETARQLRLRDLGGLIVIDFIDMRDRKHIREIEKCLKDSLKDDKARVTVGKISQFGLMEMSRQRIKAALAEGSFLSCPHCGGGGRVKSPEAQAIAFLRKLYGAVAKGQVGRVEGEVPLEVATYLLNTKREELLEMERRHQLTIVIKGRPDLLAGQAELTAIKREKDEFPTFDLPALSVLPYAEVPARVSATEPLDVQQDANVASVTADTEVSSAQPETIASSAEIKMGGEAEAEDTSGEEAGKKKRKRRRRKKKSGDSTPAEEIADEIAAQETPAEDASVGEPETAEDEVTAVGETGEKRKKRRRRKKKKSGEAAGSEAGSDMGTVEDFSAAEVPGEDHAEGPEGVKEESASGEAGEEPKKKKRRRRKKKPAAAAEIGDKLTTAVSLSPEAAEQAEPIQGEESDPKPARRVRSKKVEKIAEPAAAMANDAQELLPMPAAELPTPSAKKTRGKRGSKPAANTDDTLVREETVPLATTGAPTETTPAEGKPARQRSRRPARTTQETDDAAAAPQPTAAEMERPEKREAAATVEMAEDKPKRRPPRKKAATKKAESDVPPE